MPYERPFRVEFGHCDPARIVFYPRYLEMANHMAENFFREVVGVSYAAMMAEGVGAPTVHLEADFRAPSRLGDLLTLRLAVAAVGRSSLDLTITGAGEGEDAPRFAIAKRLVRVGKDGRPQAWPQAIRDILEREARP